MRRAGRDGELDALQSVLDGVTLTWFADEKAYGLVRTTDAAQHPNRVPILSDEGLRRHQEQCQQPWSYLREKTVEGILQQSGQTPEAVYATMEKYAAPCVSLQDVRQIPAANRLLILASETDSFFHDLPNQTGRSFVATGNKWRTSLLFTLHGLDPCEHLQTSDEFYRAYTDAIVEGRSLHVYPDMEPDLEPKTPRQRGDEPPSSDCSKKKG